MFALQSHPRCCRPAGGILAAALLLGACSPVRVELTQFRGAAMGTSYMLKYIPRDAKSSVGQAVETELARFNRVFSTYDPESEISRFNKHASTDPFPATPEFLAVVRRALQLASQTGGAYDPTVGPVLRLYGFGPGAKNPAAAPSPEALAAARARSGWQKLELTESTIRKSVPELELDLNSIAKGSGVDRVAEVLDDLGIDSYMVEIGGEVRCRGVKPGGKKWRLGVASPTGGTGPVPTQFEDRVELLDQAMATSGSYQQFRKFGTGRVHHIVDPRSGRNPAIPVVSVSVIASTCEEADGWATALMVIGPDEAERVFARHPSLDLRVLYLILNPAGEIEQRQHRWKAP